MPAASPAIVLVTFPADPGVREALEEGLGGAASLRFLEEARGQRRDARSLSPDVLLSWNPARELGSAELRHLADVRFMQLMSAGANHLPFVDLPPSMAVAGNVGAYAEPMAEHVLAMALALAKRLPQKHAELAQGQFRQRPPTRVVAGMVCGILGFGGIGRAVGRRLRALGMHIHAVNTTGETPEEVEFVGTLGDLDRVLGAADLVVIALPLMRSTHGLIGARELELMKPDAILVNVARGAIVQEEALYEHLRRRPEFMAGIDAWWTEPFEQEEFRVDFPFFELPNVLGSPHNSAIVPGIIETAARHAAANVARYLRGEPPAGVVRRQDYAGES